MKSINAKCHKCKKIFTVEDKTSYSVRCSYCTTWNHRASAIFRAKYNAQKTQFDQSVEDQSRLFDKFKIPSTDRRELKTRKEKPMTQLNQSTQSPASAVRRAMIDQNITHIELMKKARISKWHMRYLLNRTEPFAIVRSGTRRVFSILGLDADQFRGAKRTYRKRTAKTVKSTYVPEYRITYANAPEFIVVSTRTGQVVSTW